ncbi:hypothetical protein KSC_074180 [Ktedonobacter sp. SOSP1-52]|nr:hypothetical protein KSC_074180 [Ktedonobacter sp. SOSP1-52]
MSEGPTLLKHASTYNGVKYPAPLYVDACFSSVGILSEMRTGLSIRCAMRVFLEWYEWHE